MASTAAGTFSEQIGLVVEWFNTWNDCEKVVALYCLLRKLPSPQTKFLSQVLDQIVTSCSPIDLEEQANDPGQFHVCLLMYMSPDHLMLNIDVSETSGQRIVITSKVKSK